MNADPIATLLAAQGVAILDGGLASELERRGEDLADPLWSARLLLTDPAAIRRVHHDYLLAGADVVTTASYQASWPGFARHGLDPSAAEGLLRRSVRLAREACDAFWSAPAHRRQRRHPLVAASIGPYGAFLADGSEYRGDYGLALPALIDFHRDRLAVLAAAGADLLACETIPCLAEVDALARLLTETGPTAAWLSCTCRDGEVLRHGEPFVEAVALADACSGVVAVGVNCTAPDHITELLQRARDVTTKPLLAYPNRGETWDGDRRRWVPAAAGGPDLGALALEWHAAGARLIGGCCRITPDDIRAIRAALLPSAPDAPPGA